MPLLGMETPDNINELILESIKGLDNSLNILDEKLAGQDYLAGNKVSIADLSCFCELYQLETLPFDYTRYPNVNKWYKKRMQNLDHVENINEIINKVVVRAKEVGVYGKYSKTVDSALSEARLWSSESDGH